MKGRSRSIYITGVILIVTLLLLLVCGGVLLGVSGGSEEGDFTLPNTPSYGGNLDTSGRLGLGAQTLTPEGFSEPLPVMHISAEETGKMYFRYMSFANYNGDRWSKGEEYDKTLEGEYGFQYLTGFLAAQSGSPVRTLTVRNYTTQLYLPYYLAMEKGDFPVQRGDAENVAVPCPEEYTVPYVSYDGEGELPAPPAAETEYRRFVYETYTRVDADTYVGLREILERENISWQNGDVVEKVRSFVQNAAVYDLEYDRALDGEKNVVLAFLNEYKRGICQHYASAATMLYRVLGIPARYVIGYAANVSGECDVTSADAHAWTEIYRDGVGWIPVDATGGNGGQDAPVPPKKEVSVSFRNAASGELLSDLPATRTVTDGSVLILPRGYRFSKDGDEFILLGWCREETEMVFYTKEEYLARKDDILLCGTDFLVRAEDAGEDGIVLYAVWGVDRNGNRTADWDDVYCDLYFVNTSEEAGDFPSDVKGQLAGAMFVLPSADISFIRNGLEYAFVGWTTQALPEEDYFPVGRELNERFDGDLYLAGSSYYVLQDTVFYAVWWHEEGDSYSVSFYNAEEKDPSRRQIAVFLGCIAGHTGVNSPAGNVFAVGRDHYELYGWTRAVRQSYLIESEEEPVDLYAGERYLVSAEDADAEKNIVFYALWKFAYTEGPFTLAFVSAERGIQPDTQFPTIPRLYDGVTVQTPVASGEGNGTHYVLYGWTAQRRESYVYSSSEKPEAPYAAGDEYTVDHADAQNGRYIFLYAVWAEDANRNGHADYLELVSVEYVNTSGVYIEGFPENVEGAFWGEFRLPGRDGENYLYFTRREGTLYALVGWTPIARSDYFFATGEGLPEGFCSAGGVYYVYDDTVFYAVWLEYHALCDVLFETLSYGEILPYGDLEDERWERVPEGYTGKLPAGYRLIPYTGEGNCMLLGWTTDPDALFSTDGIFSGPVEIPYLSAGTEYTVAEEDATESEICFFAVWAKDRNNNGVPDWVDEHYTVKLEDTAPEEVRAADFPASAYELLPGEALFLPGSGVSVTTDVRYLLAGWTERGTEYFFEEAPASVLPDFLPVGEEFGGGRDAVFYAVYVADANGNGIFDYLDDRCEVLFSDAEGGELFSFPQPWTDVLCGLTLPLPERAYMKKEGRRYLLSGWTREQSGSHITEEPFARFEDFREAGSPYTVEGFDVLYAVWRAAGTEGDLSPAGDIAWETPEDVVALSVQADKTGVVYLRYKSFGDYAGASWGEAEEYSALLAGRYSYNYLAGAALERAGEPASGLSVVSHGSVYYLPTYLRAGTGAYDVQTSDVVYRGNTEAEYSLEYYDPVFTEAPPQLKGSYLEYAKRYAEFVRAQYLSVPAGTRTALQAFLARNGFRAEEEAEPWNIVEKVARLVSTSAVYDKNYDRSLNGEKDVALAFLETYRAGVCGHFATAATLLYRVLGIPARYVVGYVAKTEAGVWTDVMGESAHAWTEVFLDGFGWVQVETCAEGGASGYLSEKLRGARMQALQALERRAEEAKDGVAARGDLSEAEKAEYFAEAERLAKEAEERVAQAENEEDISSALRAGQTAFGEFLSKMTKAWRENALKALSDAAERAKAETDGAGTLSEREKDAYKDQIDRAVSSAREEIENSASPRGVTEAYERGRQSLAEALGGLLEEEKEPLLDALERAAERAFEEVGARDDLSADERERLLGEVSALFAGAREEVLRAVSGKEAQAAADEGVRVLREYGERQLSEYRAQAAAKLEETVREALEELLGSALPEGEKQARTSRLSAACDTADEALTKAETTAEASAAYRAGRSEIGETLGELLQAGKEAGRADLLQTAEAAKRELVSSGWEEADAEAVIDAACAPSYGDIDRAVTSGEVSRAVERGKRAVADILGPTLAEQKARIAERWAEKRRVAEEGLTGLSSEELAQYLSAIDSVFESTERAISDAASGAEAESAFRAGVEELVRLLSPLLNEAKQRAEEELSLLLQDARADVSAQGGGETLLSALEERVERALEETKNALSADEISAAVQSAKQDVASLLGAPLQRAKTLAKDKLQGVTEEALSDLTECPLDETQTAEEIGRRAEYGFSLIEYAATSREVDAVLQDAVEDIGELLRGALERFRTEALSRLYTIAKEAEQEIDGREDLLLSFKNTLIQQVRELEQSYAEQIAQADTCRAVKESLSRAESAIRTACDARKKVIEVRTASASVDVYDGAYLTAHDHTYYGELAQGHSLVVSYTGRQRDVGSSPNAATARVVDEYGNDVSALYVIRYRFGTLTVENPRKLTLTAMSAEKEYDGTPLVELRYVCSGTLPGGDRFDRVVLTGIQTERGRSENVIREVVIRNVSGEDVTKNYEITTINGTLTVR